MKKKAICTDPTWAGRSDCAHCAIRNRVLFADLPHDELNVALLAVDDLVYQPDRLLYRIGEQGKVLCTPSAAAWSNSSAILPMAPSASCAC